MVHVHDPQHTPIKPSLDDANRRLEPRHHQRLLRPVHDVELRELQREAEVRPLVPEHALHAEHVPAGGVEGGVVQDQHQPGELGVPEGPGDGESQQ